MVTTCFFTKYFLAPQSTAKLNIIAPVLIDSSIDGVDDECYFFIFPVKILSATLQNAFEIRSLVA